MTREFKNSRTQEVVKTDLTNAEILEQWGALADDSNWLWYWMVKQIQEMASAPAVKDMMAFLADSFLLAIGMGLKSPMIRLHHKDRRYKIYLSNKGTICFKTGALIAGTHDPYGDEEYMGCLFGGRFLAKNGRKMKTQDEEVLAALSTDPYNFLANASKDMSRCTFCYKPLEDARSKQVGYGATCALRWGLPWGKEYDDNVPSFAKMWATARSDDRHNVRILCAAIRKDPFNPDGWFFLGDALEEVGYTKKPSVPKAGTIIPVA